MSRSAEVLIYRSDTSTAKKAWFNCLFSIIFGSAFFLILPFMNKAQELSKEPIVKVQKIPPITKVEKKKIQKPKPPEEVKKVLEPIQAPVKIQKMSLPKLQLDLSPVSFKTDMQLTSMETDFDFSLEDLVAIDNSPAPPAPLVPSVDYSQTFAETQVDQPARRTRFVQPKYPTRAKRRGLTGTVKIELHVSSQGQVVSYKILESPHNGAFESACIRALQSETYTPAIKNGRKVSSRRIINYDFRLQR